MNEDQKAKFRFIIRNQDPAATEADVRKRLREATEKATEEAANARRKPSGASTELEGGFFGLGETAIILAIVHAVKTGAAVAALGTASAAGKDFYDSFLKKELRKLNLLPSKFKEIGSKPATEKARERAKRVPFKKSAVVKSTKKKAAKKSPAKSPARRKNARKKSGK